MANQKIRENAEALEKASREGKTYSSRMWAVEEIAAMPEKRCSQCGGYKRAYQYRHYEATKAYYRLQWSCPQCINKRAKERREQKDLRPKRLWSLEEIMQSQQLHVQYMTGKIAPPRPGLSQARGWF